MIEKAGEKEKDVVKKIGFVQALRTAFSHDSDLPKWLIGTSVAWFLLDIAYYGNTISNQQFVGAVSPHGTQIQNWLVSLLVFAFAAFPGILIVRIRNGPLGAQNDSDSWVRP